MGKEIIIICLTLGFLGGCSELPVKVKTEIVEVNKPILYCPAVNKEELSRPDSLPIDNITNKTPGGEVAVLYKATVHTLIDYVNRLELILDQYEKFNKSYDELTQELKLEKN